MFLHKEILGDSTSSQLSMEGYTKTPLRQGKVTTTPICFVNARGVVEKQECRVLRLIPIMNGRNLLRKGGCLHGSKPLSRMFESFSWITVCTIPGSTK